MNGNALNHITETNFGNKYQIQDLTKLINY